MSQACTLTGTDKRKDVQGLIQILQNGDAGTKNGGANVLDILTQLKTYGRDPKNAEPMYCKEGISTLASYAFAAPTQTSQEALRCIANALLLAPNLRQDFLDLDLLPQAAERLKSEDYDDEFLVSRVLFLLTYGTTWPQEMPLRKLSVASSISTHLLDHAKAIMASNDKSPYSGIAMMALSETLKLLFNLSARQENVVLFQPAVKPILSIFGSVQLPSRCLDAPVNLLINALVNLDLSHVETSDSSESMSSLRTNMHTLVDKLIEVSGKSLRCYTEAELETLLPPVLTVLRKIYDAGSEDLRTHMQDTLLPIHEERDVPLGKADTLPSRLLRLSSSAVAPQLRDIIPALMFELSDQDPEAFIQNIGYGFAAGFLATHNISVPENAKQTAAATQKKSDRHLVNPITGQRLDKEPVDEGPPMTMEEKEREAERLFVLFERLKATGVVDVQNPVERLTNGKLGSRIEEVDDSE